MSEWDEATYLDPFPHKERLRLFSAWASLMSELERETSIQTGARLPFGQAEPEWPLGDARNLAR